jgi:hypothetical protein
MDTKVGRIPRKEGREGGRKERRKEGENTKGRIQMGIGASKKRRIRSETERE